jgi:hypothetical protein
MPPPNDPKLKKLYELAKKRAKLQALLARIEKGLANWPTRKAPSANSDLCRDALRLDKGLFD